MKLVSTKQLFLLSLVAILILGLSNTMSAQQMDAKSKMLYKSLNKVNGGYKKLAKKKDVQYTYVYDDVKKGKDVSTERYIFKGEASWAMYKEHNVNVLPDMPGVAKQVLMDGKASMTLDGKAITDEKAIGLTVFIREVNIFWFSMMYKLDDPGTISKYLGTETMNGVTYDKVSLKYENTITKKPADDEYVLYFNPETHLVDLFFFSLPAMGVNAPILKMDLEYEKVDGVLLTTVRKGFAPNAAGGFDPLGVFTISDVKFKNGFTKADFSL